MEKSTFLKTTSKLIADNLNKTLAAKFLNLKGHSVSFSYEINSIQYFKTVSVNSSASFC